MWVYLAVTRVRSVLALYFECKAVFISSGHYPGTFPSCLKEMGGFPKPWSSPCSAALGQEGDGCPVPPQPSMPVQTGDMAVSTSASAPVGPTRAAAAWVTTSTRTRGPAPVSLSLPSCPFICFSLSLSVSCLSLSAHPSPSLTSDRLLQLRKPQLPARVREHPQRALLPLPQRVHAAARRPVLQGYVPAQWHSMGCGVRRTPLRPARSPGEGLFPGHPTWTGITLSSMSSSH